MPIELEELKLVLEELGDASDSLSYARLYALSDLAGQNLALFRTMWDAFPASRRARLLQALVELAETSFQVNFDAIFRHCLDDPYDEVRAAAIDGLWENEEVSLIGPLLTKLRTDPSVQVRTAAAAGLGRFVLAGELEQVEAPVQSRITTELLTSIYLAGESVEVRRRAVESVAYRCSPEVLEVIETAYYDEDEQMRISAIVGMGRSCDPRWKDIVLEELQSSSAAMRYEAAVACGELMLHQAVPALGRLIDDPDQQVSDASIWALGQIGGSAARQVLLRAYDDADDITRSAIEDALAEQALLEGELDFTLYELDSSLEDDFDEEAYDGELPYDWTDDDDDEDDFGLED